MGASAAQIAQAKQIASQRGYDPGLVDADNADRVNTAFPVQTKPAVSKPTAGGITKGTVANSPVDRDPAAAAAATAPASGGGGAPAAATGDGGGLSGLYSATGLTPPAGGDPSAAGAPGGVGASGTTGALDLSSLTQGGMTPGTPGQLRMGLGLRQPPQDSMALAGLRRIY